VQNLPQEALSCFLLTLIDGVDDDADCPNSPIAGNSYEDSPKFIEILVKLGAIEIVCSLNMLD
jgi:hypothetical protein